MTGGYRTYCYAWDNFLNRLVFVGMPYLVPHITTIATDQFVPTIQ